MLAQIGVGSHDEARAAVAALRAVAGGQAMLDRVEAVAGVADPLDGRDRHAVDRGHRSQASVDRAAQTRETRSHFASITVQAPHPPSPQLSFVPVRPLERR